jgi:hypothetical protein
MLGFAIGVGAGLGVCPGGLAASTRRADRGVAYDLVAAAHPTRRRRAVGVDVALGADELGLISRFSEGGAVVGT